MLHRFSINAVVLLVRSNELDKAGLPHVVERYDQAILVSCDVEHHSTTFEDTRRSKLRLHLLRSPPGCFCGFCMPGFDGTLSVTVLRTALPELPQRAFGDNAHAV